MADTFHPEMCLHPARRDEGELGKKIDYALLWNGDCPVQQRGRPAFYALLDLDLPVEEWEMAGEYLRRKIAERSEKVGSITQKDMEGYVEAYRSFTLHYGPPFTRTPTGECIYNDESTGRHS
jgi:hypothetical protein